MTILELLLNNFPDLVRVTSILETKEISEIVKEEFGVDLVDEPLKQVKELNIKNKALFLKPKILIKNPLSIILTSHEVELDKINKYNNFLVYLENFIELPSLSSLALEVKKVYGEEIKYGLKVFTLSDIYMGTLNKKVNIVINTKPAQDSKKTVYRLYKD